MKLIVKGVHVRVTKRLRAYVEEHLYRPLLRFYDNEAAELWVILRDGNGPKRGNDRECRVTVYLPASPALHVDETSDEMEKSICFARDRLERLAKKTIDRQRRPAAHRISKPLRLLAEDRHP